MEQVSEQLIDEIRKRAQDLDRLRYGEVNLKVQDGKVVWGEIKTTWRADSNLRGWQWWKV